MYIDNGGWSYPLTSMTELCMCQIHVVKGCINLLHWFEDSLLSGRVYKLYRILCTQYIYTVDIHDIVYTVDIYKVSDPC